MNRARGNSTYLPYIDGLRAVAVLSVLLYHICPAWLPGGFSGVDVFFVISGFVVSASVASLERYGPVKFMLYFYARRLQRIAPALVVCLLVTTVAATLLIPEAWLSTTHQQTGLYAFFGLSNIILARSTNDYFSPTAEFNPYTHTWSLGVEEQFYFAFPLLFFAWTYRGQWRRLSVGLFLIFLLISLGWSAWLAQTDQTHAFNMITSRFWQLASGVLLFGVSGLVARKIAWSQSAISLNTVSRHAQDWYPNKTEPRALSPGCIVTESRRPLGSGVIVTYTRQHCAHPASAPPLFAIGDSHTLAYTGLFKGYAMATGAPVTVYNNEGCPIITLLPRVGHCIDQAQLAPEDLLTQTRSGDVVFLSSLRMPRFTDQYSRFPESSVTDLVFSKSAAQARRQASLEAAALLRRFSERGVQVIIEAPKPVFRSPTFRCAHAYNLTNPIGADGTDMDRAQLQRLRLPILDELNKFANTIPLVSVWDSFQILCPPQDKCRAIQNGLPLYFDGDHLSGYGNRLLLPGFLQFIATLRNRSTRGEG